LLDALGEHRQLIVADGTALTGLADSRDHLRPAEGLTDAGPLQHGQRGRLHGREAPGAVRALSTAPDRRAIVGRARVHDTGVGLAAGRTVRAAGIPASRLGAAAVIPARATAPDRRAIVGRERVHDTGVGMAAERTVHPARIPASRLGEAPVITAGAARSPDRRSRARWAGGSDPGSGRRSPARSRRRG